VFRIRLIRGAPAIDVRLRSARTKSARWISALVLLIGAAAVATGLILAAFGLFAALRIAYGYGASVERVSAAAGFAPRPWQREAGGGADRGASAALVPAVVASSDPTENERGLETGSMRSAPPAGNAEPGEIAGDSAPSSARPAASAPIEMPATASAVSAPNGEMAGSIDRIAAPARPIESAARPPQQTKRHHAIKHHAARKPVRRIVRRPVYPAAPTSPFQPIFNSP